MLIITHKNSPQKTSKYARFKRLAFLSVLCSPAMLGNELANAQCFCTLILEMVPCTVHSERSWMLWLRVTTAAPTLHRTTGLGHTSWSFCSSISFICRARMKEPTTCSVSQLKSRMMKPIQLGCAVVTRMSEENWSAPTEQAQRPWWCSPRSSQFRSSERADQAEKALLESWFKAFFKFKLIHFVDFVDFLNLKILIGSTRVCLEIFKV